MIRENCSYLFVAIVSISSPALAAQPSSVCIADCSDSGAAVSSLLLAAGMYGGLNSSPVAQGLDLSRSESARMFKGILAEQGQVDGQDITLSYNGSEGSRLGFSAGYLYTAPENSPESGAVLIGTDQHSGSLLHEDGEKPWYVTFNLAKDFKLSDNLALGIDSRTMLVASSLLQNEEKKDGQAVCMSFNLPISYGKFLTVTPELQWSRALEASGQISAASGASNPADASDKNPNTFYGGMSISFSY